MNIGASLGPSAVQRPPRPTKSPEEVFKSLDTQNKGYLTQSEFESSTSSISPEGAKLAKQDATDAAAAFARLDSDQDGKLTSAEFKAGAPSGPPSAEGDGAAGASGTQRGARPPPPPPGGGGGKGSASSKTSSYDAADTNQDGTVSAAEKAAAQAKSLAQESSGNGFAARLALRLYQSTEALA